MRRPPNIPRRMQSPAIIGERSGLTSPREPNSLYRNWAYTQQASIGTSDASSTGRSLISRVSGFVPRGTTARMHPFKIYQVPVWMRGMPTDPNNYGTLTQDKWWRCFRVRAGWFMGTDCTATDAEDANPDMDSWPPATYDILVPDNTAAFYFWLETDTATRSPAAVVRWGEVADANAGSYTSSEYSANDWSGGTPWDTAPDPDSNHILLAKVDTNSFDGFAQVRQYVREDIETAGGSSGSTCKIFQITTVGGGSLWDYFKAKEVSAGGLIGPEINIAKQSEYRPSMSTEFWDSTQTDYSWTDDNNRTSTIHGSSPTVSQTEILWPRIAAGSHPRNIVAIQVPYTGVTVSGQDLSWLDITPRVWQRIYGQ